LHGASPSPASDIYALGVLLFHLASGEFPYEAKGLDALLRAQDGGMRSRLAKLQPNLPADLVHAIEAALDPEPARRPPTALAFAAALAAHPAPAQRQWPWALLVLAGVLTLALLAIGLWPRDATPSWQATTDFVRIDEQGSVPIVSGTGIALGDRLALQFRSNAPAFVYVFDDDDSGTTAVLFPLPGVQPTNPLVAGPSYRLPGRNASSSLSWQVSSAASRDEFVVIAATTPQPELERMIADWQHADAVHASPSRGVVGLAGAPANEEIASAPLRQIVERLEHGNAGEVRHWRFVFPHAPVH
jgi:serine/threonine protein kinase